MKTSRIIKVARRIAEPYRISDGRKFRLKDVDPADTGALKSEDKPRAKEALDAAGKDGAIKHVMSGVNPQGCEVYSFKAPNKRYLTHNGVVIRKFFLHVARAEQKRRFLERLEEPEKNWKFSPFDVRERGHWKDYMRAYEDAIRETATRDTPWFVVPADNKWFTRVVVAAAIIDALGSLDLHYPKVGKPKRKELAAAKQALLAEV